MLCLLMIQSRDIFEGCAIFLVPQIKPSLLFVSSVFVAAKIISEEEALVSLSNLPSLGLQLYFQ